ncbi:MAG: nitroreductase, partial [Steroidobacteraceae bacterium]|nr:nitroreductase [Steroidobacteraceae bacterium]
MLTVTEALKRRISTRVFLPTPLPKAVVYEILDVARYAPSGGNTQPWKVIALSGSALRDVIALAQRAVAEGASEEGEYPVYPPNLWEPYRTRRYILAEQMYALLGIPRADKPARLAHVARNFEAFGAPVLLLFVTDRRFGHGQWAHLGMFMQSVALAALERGVASCMQESWARVRATLHRHFALPAHEVIYAGIALGFADPDAAVNR